MVFMEVISSVHLVVSLGIFVLMCGLFAAITEEYKPPPMDENAKRMYN